VYQHTLEQARIAEDGGLDAYYLTEHHFNPGFQIVPSPHLLVSALAQLTHRIRLGVMCTNLPLHHPVRVAEEIRMMDLLTNGRLEMGFGRGTAGHEQAGYGVDRAQTEALFDHSFSLVRELLTTGRVDEYQEGPWSGGAVVLAPEATQRPHPPLWMTGMSEKSLRKAARLGLSLCTAFLDSGETEKTHAVYQDAWEEFQPGVARAKYGTLQHVFVAESEDEARRWARPQLERWLDAGLEAVVASKPVDGAIDPGYEEHAAYFERMTSQRFDQAVANGRIIFGTPDQCVEQLLQKAACGVDLVQGWFQFGGLDHAASNRSLALFCREVAPAVRAAMAPRSTQAAVV
jgi:alkanesulfonate monooxygenase SsuD/methylene tetrahydromethanopterin reductase-like flavin-dependent oxidoreductase (luciferase family)